MNVRKLLRLMGLPMFLLLSIISYSQDRVITGQITDSAGRGIAGATVTVKGLASRGTVTSADGTYSLSVPATATALIVSSVGYGTQEVSISGQTASITLIARTDNLSEIVVIGYGTARKKDLTGAITTVTAKDFNKGVIVSPDQLIAGKVAGVQVAPNDGAPGSGSTIRIRGGASLNASNDPLIVIDGMPLSNSNVPGVANQLALLNPNDIASFTILKDASATAIYGSRASNGVILITTKKGQSGKPKFNFVTQLSAGVLAKEFDNLSPSEFRTLVNTYGTAGQKALLGTANTNWQDEIYQTAITTDNNLSIAGALNKLPYRVSVGYLNQNGILQTGNLQRISTTLNLNPVLLNNHLKVDFSARGSFSKSRFANTDAVWGANQFDPTQPVYSKSSRYGGYWERLDPANTNTGLAALSPKNPLGLLEQKKDIGHANRLITNVALDYKLHFFPDMHAIANAGYDMSKGYGEVTINDSAAMMYRSFTAKSGTVHGGERREYESDIDNWFTNFYLNYTKNITPKHKIEAMAGTEYQQYQTTNYSFNTYAYDTALKTTPQYPFDKPESRIISFLARVNYSFNNIVFLTGTFRRDGSSKFAPDYRWANFPSTALALNLNEMIGGLKNSNTIDNLKLRIGYGVTGQQDGIGLYDYISYYGLSDVRAQYQLGNTFYQMYRPGGYYEPRKWEQTATTNLAIDYGLFDNRLSGSVDFYYKKTKDLLNQITQPAFTNFSNQIVANVGTMENKGVEISVTGTPIRRKDFNWDVSFNATYNKNEITQLDINDIPGFINQIAGIGGLGGVIANAVGHPRGSFYVFKQIYDKTGKPVENLFEDLNRDGIINNSDLMLFQSSNPDWFFGFSTNATYKKWTGSLTMRANYGNYLYNNVATNGAISKFLFGSYLSNQSADVLNTNFFGTGNFYQSNYYVQNASFIKMDNVNIGYNLGKISKSLNLRLNAGVMNVFTITNYEGLDPEVNGGIDNNQYPRPRTFLVGAALDF